jgi:hypothetical protein
MAITQMRKETMQQLGLPTISFENSLLQAVFSFGNVLTDLYESIENKLPVSP